MRDDKDVEILTGVSCAEHSTSVTPNNDIQRIIGTADEMATHRDLAFEGVADSNMEGISPMEEFFDFGQSLDTPLE